MNVELINSKRKYSDKDGGKDIPTLSEIFDKRKYVDLGYEEIIVVAHGGVIRRYTGVGLIAYCEV